MLWSAFDFHFLFCITGFKQISLFFLKQLDALIDSMNPKGVRERALKKQLQKFYSKIWSANSTIHLYQL